MYLVDIGFVDCLLSIVVLEIDWHGALGISLAAHIELIMLAVIIRTLQPRQS